MTSEQIAELRKLHDDVIAQAGPWGGREFVDIPLENWRFLVACNNHLPRLLDEREALLEALRGAGEAVHSEYCGGTYHVPACEEATAAIAKAEAP